MPVAQKGSSWHLSGEGMKKFCEIKIAGDTSSYVNGEKGKLNTLSQLFWNANAGCQYQRNCVTQKEPASSSKTERVRLGFVEKQVIALLQSRISLNNNKASHANQTSNLQTFLRYEIAAQV